MSRAEVAARIQEAKEHGDITENAEYEDAKNEQAFVEGRIQTLSALIKNAVLIEEHHSDDARPDRLDGRARSARTARRASTIVGSAEAAPAEGKHLERVAGRSRAAGHEEGRQGHRHGPGRGLHVQDRQHQLTADGVMPAGEPGPGAGLLGRRDCRRGRRSRRSSTIPRRPRAPSTSAACAVSCCTTPSAARCRTRARRSSSATASTTSTRWTPRRC